MKSIFNLLAGVFCSALIFGCSPEITELNETSSTKATIEISTASITLRETTTANVTATIRPWNYVDKTIEWSSSDSEIATVDQNGLITAVSVGEATISAKCRGAVATCTVTVISWEIPAEFMEVGTPSLSMKVSESQTISCTWGPSNTTDRPVWASENEEIASVDNEGKVTAHKPGTTYIHTTLRGFSHKTPVLVHGNIWLEQTDALTRPVYFETHPWEPDTIRVARGETATLQTILYTATDQGTITPSVKYFAPKGQNAGLSVSPEIYWLPYIKCSSKWDSWAGGSAPDRYPDKELYFPDPMMPANEYSLSLTGSQMHGLWVEFEIPRDLPAGIYEGCVAVQGADYGELPFVVQVYDVTLPEKQTLDIIQWINGELHAMNNGSAMSTNDMYTMLEEVIVPLVRKFGQNGFRAINYDRPSIRHAVKNSDGSYTVLYDFSALEREMNLFLRACPDMHYYQAKTGSMLVDVSQKGSTGILGLRAFELDETGNLKVTDNGDGTYSPIITYVDQAGTNVPEAEMYAKQYFSALEDFLSSHNLPDGRTWLDIFCQAVCDEPNDATVAAYNQLAGYIKKHAPGIKTMDPLGTLKIKSEVLDIPCPCIDQLKDDEYPDGYPWNDELQTRWIYSAVGPQGDAINRFIRVPLIKTRLMHWLNYRYKAVGYLHWGLNYWVGAPDGDPWQNATGSYIGGDMFIIWPGYRTAYPSIRLAAMRDGIRDYELLKMLGETDAVKAMELCRSKATNYLTHNTDVDEFRQTRKTILELLSKTPVNQ